MRYLIFLGHPAHFHLFKNIISKIEGVGHETKVLIRSKDVLEELCVEENLKFQNVLPEARQNSYPSLILSYARKYKRISKIIREFRPDLLLGSEPSLTHLGKIFSIPSFIFSEDDASIIPQFASVAYPFTDIILSPKSCDAGRWNYKKIGYDGFHKLSYLHPKVFFPNDSIQGIEYSGKFFVLRFASLTAYHDDNRLGISNEIAKNLISMLSLYGQVFITSERKLPNEFEKYRLTTKASAIHHLLAKSALYIGDSQSMAVEAALLGTPGIRLNDFAGEIGVLNELEFEYGLTRSFKTNEPRKFLETVEEMASSSSIQDIYRQKRAIMLRDKINVLEFFVWFILNFPTSRDIMKSNPDFQYTFR